MSDEEIKDTGPGPNVPQDRAFKAPVNDPDPPIENSRGKLVSKPNTSNLGKDTSVVKLPSLDAMERQISNTFFKDATESRDQTTANLLSGSFDRIKSKSTSVIKRWTANTKKVSAGPTAGVLPNQTAAAAPITTSPVYVGIMAAGAQAQVEQLRFLKTYQLPYMKRQLALSYLRTDYARRQLGLLDQTRRDIVAKLDVVKTNLAVPDAAKGTLFAKIMEETRRQAIARVASSIQDIGFQYANRFYTNTITRKAAELRDRLSGKHGLRDLISDSARAHTRSLLRKAAVAGEYERSARAHEPDNSALYGTYRTKRRALLMAARAQRLLIAPERGQDLGGKILSPIADFASKYNPFNKNIFVPTMTSGGGNDFVSTVDSGVVGTPTAGKSPLFIAFTNWVSENRKDQDALRRILLGEKVDPNKLIHKGNPAKEAMSKWKPLSSSTTSSDTASGASSGQGFFKGFFKSKQFKSVKDTVRDSVNTALAPERDSAEDAPGIRGKINKTVNSVRKDARKILSARADRAAQTVDATQPHVRFRDAAFKTPFVAGVKDTASAIFGKSQDPAQTDGAPASSKTPSTPLFGRDTLQSVKDHISDAYASTKTQIDKTISDAYAENKKLNPSKKMRKKKGLGVATKLVDQAVDLAPSALQRKLKAAAGLGLIVAPFAARAISKSAGKKYKEVENRSVLDDLHSVADGAVNRVSDAASALADSALSQRIQNSDRFKDTTQSLSKAARRASLYGKKGLRYARRSRIGRDIEDHITSTPAYQEFMDTVSPRTLTDRLLGSNRTRTLSRDMRKLKGMNYKTLGKAGVGLLTGTAALSAARYGYNFVRGKDTSQQSSQLKNYFGISGLSLPKLVSQLKTTAYSGLVSEGDIHRLELGEPLHRVLSPKQINQLSKLFRAQRNTATQKLNAATQTASDAIGGFVGRHTNATLGGFAGSLASSGVYQASNVFGSLSENIDSITRAVGIKPKDNIFTKYVDGLKSVNAGVKEGSGLFRNIIHSVFGKNAEERSKARGAVAGTAAIAAGSKWLKRHLMVSNRDRIIAEGIANRTPLEKAARVGLLTARNVFYNPERYTRDEFKEHQKEVSDAKAARAEKLKASREAFRKSRADAKARRQQVYKERDAEKKRQQQAAKDAKNPTLASLLLSRLGLGPQPRAGSWKEQMKQRDLERRGSWYSWRRAFGRKGLKGDDVHKYADRFGLFGGLMDTGSAFSNSLLGTVAGQALGLAGRATGATARFGGRMALRGFDAAREIGLRGAVKAGKGFLPMVGGGLKLAGGLLKGPLGIGLAAHEIDQGFAENTTGATRRIGTTAAKMAEYGAMGAFFGPWGIAIGAGVGALVANMDYVKSALHGVGSALSVVTKPLWGATKAVAGAAWDVTKFSARVAKGMWTTVFGQSAKLDSHGRVIRQEKNSILGDFRVALFGQKAKFTKDGQLIAPSKRSVFGVIHDGFTKTFFGDKFSNGAYKPGTSLVDMAWDSLKSGVVTSAKFFYNLPGKLWGNISKGFSSLWDSMKGIKKAITDKISALVDGASDLATRGINAVKNAPKNAWNAVRNAPKKIKKTIKNLANKGKAKVRDMWTTIRNEAKYAAAHPFLATADAVISTEHAIGHIPGASPVAGAAAASSKWILNSMEMLDANSPVRRYIKASLDLYGVDNTGLYEFVHQIETDQEKVAQGKLKQYNQEDMRWFAGKFGLDPKNDDCVNYFVTWFNNRFLPMFKIIGMTLSKYKVTVSNVLNAPNLVIETAAKALEGAKKTIPAAVTQLKPSLAGYQKQANAANTAANALNATTIKSPGDKSAVVGKPSDAKGTQPGQSNANSPSGNTPQNSGTGPAGPYNPDAPTTAPQVTPGKVTDQKEYKSAYNLLAKNVKAMVDSDKSLQFTLWAESVQDGPQKTAHTFNTEFREGETVKNFRDDIYQDRGQHFTGNTDADKIAAMRQLAKEQDFASGITATSGYSLQQMGDAIGHPIMAFGNGTVPTQPTPTKPEQLKKAAEISKYIMNKYHYSPQFAAAMAAQEVVESRMNPTAVGDGGSAYGAFQWHPDRQRKIYEHFKKPLQQMSLEEQTDAAIWELQSGTDPQSKGLLQEVGQAKDTRSAVSAFVNEYERPADRTGNVIARTSVADQIMKTLQSGSDAASGGGNTITRGDQTKEQMSNGSGASGAPVGADGAAQSGATGSGASGGAASTPTVNANVDQSGIEGKLDAIHKTLQQSQSGQTPTPGATMSTPSSPATMAPQSTPAVPSPSQSIIINHSPTQAAAPPATNHGSVVDMQMKKAVALAGVVQ